MTIGTEQGNLEIQTTVELNNGVKMPVLGLGTSHSGGYCHQAVVYALKECGYRLIDTAKRYGVEEMLRKSINESGIDREDLFLATKMWPTDYGLLSTRPALDASIKRLGTDYLDLYMLHFPVCHLDCGNHRLLLEETWRGMERLEESGVCRAIGVSNFEVEHLEELLDICSLEPQINQFELHPFQNNLALRVLCSEHNIQVQEFKTTTLSRNHSRLSGILSSWKRQFIIGALCGGDCQAVEPNACSSTHSMDTTEWSNSNSKVYQRIPA